MVHCCSSKKFIIIKLKVHSSCEIEYFVETHLCELCVMLRSRVLHNETHLSLQAVCDTPIARITGYVSSLRI